MTVRCDIDRNVSPIGSQPVAHVHFGVNMANAITIESAQQLRDLIATEGVGSVLFYRTDFPRRPVPVDKCEKWFRKIDRVLQEPPPPQWKPSETARPRKIDSDIPTY